MDATAKLKWTRYGENGFQAQGGHGTWRIETNGQRWYLTIQPTFTRGMLLRGDFGSAEQAQESAQQHEDDKPAPQPLRIQATTTARLPHAAESP